ncbi:MAG: mechanosensitive ion channel [Vicinamibacterales bacterium]
MEIRTLFDQAMAVVGSFVPSLLGALAILLVGWVMALIAAAIVRGVLNRTSLDNRLATLVAGRDALGGMSIERIAAKVAFYVVMLFVLVAFFQALGLTIVTSPLNALLLRLMESAPQALAPLVLLGVALLLATVVRSVVSRGLHALALNRWLGDAEGVDRIPVALGLMREPMSGAATPSSVAATVALAAIVLFGVAEAGAMLGFEQFATMVSTFLLLAGRIVLAVVMFALGLCLAGLAGTSLAASRIEHAAVLATLARGGIVLFSTSVALRATGLANEIVDLAFGITFGAVVVAAALAFGLGSRETAGRFVEDWTRPFHRREP